MVAPHTREIQIEFDDRFQSSTDFRINCSSRAH
jgi:hypothetical protein